MSNPFNKKCSDACSPGCAYCQSESGKVLKKSNRHISAIPKHTVLTYSHNCQHVCPRKAFLNFKLSTIVSKSHEMQLASLKTIAYVWCIVFVLWVVKSSSEASSNPNGLTDGHSQGKSHVRLAVSRHPNSL